MSYLANIAERAAWTFVQAFFAVVIVATGWDIDAVYAGLAAGGLSVVKNVVLPLATKRMAALEN